MTARPHAITATILAFGAAIAGMYLTDAHTKQWRGINHLSPALQGAVLFWIAAVPIAAPQLLDLLAPSEISKRLKRITASAVTTILCALGAAWAASAQPWIPPLVLLGGIVLTFAAAARVDDEPPPTFGSWLAIIPACAGATAVPLAIAAVLKAVDAALV